MEKRDKTVKYIRYFSRSVLLAVSSFWFIFALLSGAEKLGGGIKGIILNSPNALPWLLLFVLVWAVKRWELIGGILIALVGVLTIFVFDTLETLFTFFSISFPLIVLGLLLVIASKLSKISNNA
jgi:hypothetical protein